MPVICEDIILNCSMGKAFVEMASVDFMKRIDPIAHRTEILFQSERLLRTITQGTPSGDVELEKIIIPENHTLVTIRRPPLGIFLYQVSIKMLSEHKDGTRLRHINDFELDDSNKPREEMILSIVRKNDILNLQKIKEYFG